MYIVKVVQNTGLTLSVYTCKSVDQTVRQMLLQYHAIRKAAQMPFESISEDLLQSSFELLDRGESVTWGAPAATIRAKLATAEEFMQYDGKRRIQVAKKARARLH